MSEIRYMISETAKQVDVEAHVLRYWEEELSLPIGRNEMGHRYYTEDDITLFQNIRDLKEQGFQLKAIKMLLPELRRNGGLDMDRLLKQREELNLAAQEQAEPDGKKAGEEQTGLQQAEEGSEPGHAVCETPVSAETDRMQQFQMILGNIVLKALQENNRELSRSVSDQVSSRVSDHVLKEVDYLMRVREEREDERFKKLDETIRLTQRSRKEAAAARVEARRLKKLEKKEKRRHGGFAMFGKK